MVDYRTLGAYTATLKSAKAADPMALEQIKAMSTPGMPTITPVNIEEKAAITVFNAKTKRTFKREGKIYKESKKNTLMIKIVLAITGLLIALKVLKR